MWDTLQRWKLNWRCHEAVCGPGDGCYQVRVVHILPAVVCYICLLPSDCLCVWLCVRACMYKMDMTQQYELEGWFRLVHRANGTIMDIRGLGLPGICIWVFCNLTLLQKDASAPPVIYHSIKPILYYNLIHLPLVQTKAMSVLCNFSKPFLSSTQLLYFCLFPAINWVNTSENYYQSWCAFCFLHYFFKFKTFNRI